MRKKIQHIIVVITLSSSATYAQVGIGNAVPHGGAILDLNNPDKGLALPVISIPSSDTLGMLYFDAADSIVMYNDGGNNYNGLSPWKFKYGAPPIASNDMYYDEDGNVGIGITNPAVKLSIDGGTEAESSGNNGFVLIGDPTGYQLVIDDDEIMVKSDPNTMDTLKLQEGGGTVQVGESQAVQSTLNVFGKVQESGFNLVPQGVIVMWHGNTSNIPKGWALCDGNFYNPSDFTDVGSSATNSAPYTQDTPDLRGKFIISSGSRNQKVMQASGSITDAAVINFIPHDTGGADEVILSVAEMPNHNHVVQGYTETDGKHRHRIPIDNGAGGGIGYNSPNAIRSTVSYFDNSGSPGINAVIDQWAYSLSQWNANNESAHSHYINFGSQYQGNDEKHENTPVYYSLCYIMKL